MDLEETLNVMSEALECEMGSGSSSEEEEAGLELEHPIEDDYYSDDLADNSTLVSGLDYFASNGGDRDTPLEPLEGMEFDSEQAARIFYNSYARRIGFSTRVSVYQRSRRDGTIVCRQLVCSRQGFRRRCSENKSKRRRTVTRVGCKAQITAKKQSSGKWAVTKFVREHNHELVPPDKVHCLRSHRHVSGPARSLIDTLQAAGMGSSEIMTVLIKESGGADNVGFTKTDCQNYMSSNRQRTLGNAGQYILNYFKQVQAGDPAFFYALQGEVENSSGNIFWVDATSRLNYKYFGDTVIFDTTYRTNRYRVPFAPFTGWNHHGQPVLFGCALLFHESESSFIWLFQTFLSAMSGRCPISITTDQDRIIRAAVAEVFPGTRHRFCKWNVFKEANDKLSHIYRCHPTLEVEFQRCINGTETIEEFESCWFSLIERYDLEQIEWLHSMYTARHQWVPVHLRDTFFGEISVTQSSDSVNSFFDGYINASTNFHILIKQYEKATVSRHEMEVKADYETITMPPALRTPSPMEKQAATLYTRGIFMKFQDELVETLANPATVVDHLGSETVYRVEKFGEDHKAHFIRFNLFEKKANCSCQMFEFSGILCRHILSVFRVANVLTLPSHFILKRWTRNAKSEALLDEHSLYLSCNPQESSAFRYENLCKEAIRYTEEGVASLHVYKVAMEALHEASLKVSASEKHNPLIFQGTMDQDKRIHELSCEIEIASQQCEAYRAKLFAVLKGMEEQRLKIKVNVGNVRLHIK